MKNRESMTDNEKYMQLAIEKSIENVENGGGPFGAVIVKNGEVIAATSNSVTIDNDPTAHAEVNAIRQACRKLGTFDLSGCELYTTAEPCPMCFGAILWANIRKVYYGCTIADTDKIGFRDEIFCTSSFDIKTEMDRSECLNLFEEYKAIKDRKSY